MRGTVAKRIRRRLRERLAEKDMRHFRYYYRKAKKVYIGGDGK